MMRAVATLVAGALTAPLLGLDRVAANLGGADAAWLVTSQRSARWTGPLGVFRRRWLFERTLALAGDEVAVNVGALLTKRSIELGDRVYVGAYSILGDVRIGDDTLLGDHVCVLSGASQHGTERLDIPIREQPETYDTVHVGRDSWIGSRAIVMADVGSHCVVGAGSVVTKPVPDYAIVVGNPARQVGDRRARAVS
jgi:virginiamycin A acetyltransferase